MKILLGALSGKESTPNLLSLFGQTRDEVRDEAGEYVDGYAWGQVNDGTWWVAHEAITIDITTPIVSAVREES